MQPIKWKLTLQHFSILTLCHWTYKKNSMSLFSPAWLCAFSQEKFHKDELILDTIFLRSPFSIPTHNILSGKNHRKTFNLLSILSSQKDKSPKSQSPSSSKKTFLIKQFQRRLRSQRDFVFFSMVQKFMVYSSSI